MKEYNILVINVITRQQERIVLAEINPGNIKFIKNNNKVAQVNKISLTKRDKQSIFTKHQS